MAATIIIVILETENFVFAFIFLVSRYAPWISVLFLAQIISFLWLSSLSRIITLAGLQDWII